MSKKTRGKKSGETWRRFRRNKPAMVGMVIFAILILITLSAGLIVDYDTQVIRNNARERLQPPSAEHWFGTVRSALLRRRLSTVAPLRLRKPPPRSRAKVRWSPSPGEGTPWPP